MCDLVCDMARGSNAHQPQVLLYLLVVHDFQKGRLLELDGEPLAQGAVKHGVARRVGEIGEDNGVLVGEFGCAVEIEVAAQGGSCQKQSSRCQLPATAWRGRPVP